MEACESPTEATPQWAVIELMGHVRYGGLVSKDNQFGTAMLRVDVPTGEKGFATQLVNPQSIYRLTLCEESIARAAAKSGQHVPMQRWELQQHGLALPEGEQTYSDQSMSNPDDEPAF